MIKRIAAVVICLGVALGTSYTPALANDDPIDGIEPMAVIEVPMTVDCTSVPDTKEARDLLRQHGLCGYGEATQGPRTESTTIGGCGSLTLTIWDDPANSGYIHWQVLITSFIGPWIYVTYDGSWTNISTGASAPVTYGSVIWPTSYFQHDLPILTGNGSVFGYVPFAMAQTAVGGVLCYNNGGVSSTAWVQ